MSREIKFRVWSVIRESWVHPVLDITNDFKLSDNENRVIEQFTGLPDKNDVDIYDGDILDNKEVVKYSIEQACYFAGGVPLCMSNSHRSVIGNIHENKDLIS
jgi:hypothetical protein